MDGFARNFARGVDSPT